MAIAITHDNRTTHGTYQGELAGASRPAILTWRATAQGARIIEHTFVPPEMRGQGMAQLLVEAIVADARAEGFRIVPQCSYADVLFRRHPEWAGLLEESR